MTGKYQPYPAYKDSGVEWVGEIPENWRLAPLKYAADLCSNKCLPESNSSYVGLENIESQTGRHLSKAEENVEGVSSKFKRGDILFGKLRPYLAKSWLSEFSGYCSSEFLVLRSRILDSRFLHKYTLTDEFISIVDSSTYGSKMPRANWDFIGGMMLPMPPSEDSIHIANFLDHETAKIDTLIAKQEKLIELLQEKRQAVISHAVTKGLDPDVPMKDSGVEWLGEVPAHWVVPKLSYRYDVKLGKMLDDKKIIGNHLAHYLRNTDIQWDSINRENLPKMDFKPDEVERYSVKKGDLLVCEGGEIGRCAIWENECTCYYQKALHRLRPTDKEHDHSRFMFYVLFDAVHQERFFSSAEKATIAHLPAETFRQYRFAFPPLPEQINIAAYLDNQKSRYDLMERKALSQINLLKERRTALISAAVTGKIDVRNWKLSPPKDA